MKKRAFLILLGICGIALGVVFAPFIILYLIIYGFYALALYLLVWLCWIPKGKDILFIYSDSPVWHDYVQNEIIPYIKSRAVILNWTERKKWAEKRSLQALLFKNFGGYSEFNPLALYFRPFRLVKSYRFRSAFRDWKHGKTKPLEDLKNQFLADIN